MQIKLLIWLLLAWVPERENSWTFVSLNSLLSNMEINNGVDLGGGYGGNKMGLSRIALSTEQSTQKDLQQTPDHILYLSVY